MEKVVVCVYASELDEAEQAFADHQLPIKVEFLPTQDVANPGFFNINRQVHQVSTGLRSIHRDAFVIKLRSDQSVDFHLLAALLKKQDYFAATPAKILTTNCYTRADRLYHPSDMFLCGRHEALTQYYSLPYQRATHMDRVLDVCNQNAVKPSAVLSGAPEELLFRHYLATQGWRCLDTADDSMAALRRFCHVANSWDIALQWTKSRTPFFGENSVILPYTFTMAPFASGPIEEARCLSRHEVEQTRPSLRDYYFLNLSTAVWKYSQTKVTQTGYLARRLGKVKRSLVKRLVPRRLRPAA